MFIAAGQLPIYLIVDALDESPDTSKVVGTLPSRQKVLEVVKELVQLRLPSLRTCVTSRPEVDIQRALEPLASFKLSLHDQDGQKEDIASYVRSVVYSDTEQEMTRWRPEVKELVAKTLSEKANGMYVCSSKFMTLYSHCNQGFVGLRANWKRCGIVFHAMSSVCSESCPNPWTKHTHGC
jgi:hypothetical protein